MMKFEHKHAVVYFSCTTQHNSDKVARRLTSDCSKYKVSFLVFKLVFFLFDFNVHILEHEIILFLLDTIHKHSYAPSYLMLFIYIETK